MSQKKRQLDKFCPIIKGFCSRNCTFYVEPTDKDSDSSDDCQLSLYVRNNYTPNKSTAKKAKPLLEGSDKKI